MTEMDDRFWKKWDSTRDLLKRCEMLEKIDRLSYDHVVSWLENARRAAHPNNTGGCCAGNECPNVVRMTAETKSQTAQAIFAELDHISRYFDSFTVGTARYSEERSMDNTDYQALKAKYLKAKECNCLRAYGHSKTCPAFVSKAST